MSAPKGVRVTVGRLTFMDSWGTIRPPSKVRFTYAALRKAGVPALRPGESVTGRMVFVPDKKGRR